MSLAVQTIRDFVQRTLVPPRAPLRRIHVPKVAVRTRYIHTQSYDRGGRRRPSLQSPVINARV